MSLQESEAVAQNAVRELKEAASRFRAAEQQLAQESELRSSAERHAAELEASLQALEAEKAAHEAKVKLVLESTQSWLMSLFPVLNAVDMHTCC